MKKRTEFALDIIALALFIVIGVADPPQAAAQQKDIARSDHAHRRAQLRFRGDLGRRAA